MTAGSGVSSFVTARMLRHHMTSSAARVSAERGTDDTAYPFISSAFRVYLMGETTGDVRCLEMTLMTETMTVETPAQADTCRGRGPTDLESNVSDPTYPADHPRNTVAPSEWLARWIADTKPQRLADCEVFVVRKNFANSPQFLGLSPEAFYLHFASWSATSNFPKWRGHVSLHRDKGLLYNRSNKTVHRFRNELVRAGLRLWCQGDGYKLCDEWCQSIIDWVPSHVAKNPHPQSLRQAARAILPTVGLECEECGADRDLTVDHIVPISKGGGNDSSNLRVLCRSCNSTKGARF